MRLASSLAHAALQLVLEARRCRQPINAAQGFGVAETTAKKPRKKAKVAEGAKVSKTSQKVR